MDFKINGFEFGFGECDTCSHINMVLVFTNYRVCRRCTEKANAQAILDCTPDEEYDWKRKAGLFDPLSSDYDKEGSGIPPCVHGR